MHAQNMNIKYAHHLSNILVEPGKTLVPIIEIIVKVNNCKFRLHIKLGIASKSHIKR